ncbi:hypothetical protein [Methylosinus sp. LW4]|uniref:hypothetical protein n=1 Tax=Methylosinus sp. LW4 TaxID=136993 RepID=UPI00036D48A0|nr:hypothetical protein [Methylosinus sp. LW4]
MNRLSRLLLCLALSSSPIAAEARGHGGHHGGHHHSSGHHSSGHHGGGHHRSSRSHVSHSVAHSFVHSIATGAGGQIGRDMVRSHNSERSGAPISAGNAADRPRSPARIAPARAACPADADNCRATVSAAPNGPCAKACGDLLRQATH